MIDDDFKLLRVFADKRTDEQTFVIVELLLRLKKNAAIMRNLKNIYVIDRCADGLFQC